MNATHALRRETEATRRLLANLHDLGAADDAEIVETAIEGETNFIEAIAAVVDEIDECQALVTGLKAKEQDFSNRRAAVEKRIETMRAAIEAAMVEAEQPNLKLPSATLYLSKRAPSVVVDNEAEIPARFWIDQPRPAPKLDKKALKAALAAKEDVPGARLDNGSISLGMR